MMRNVLWVRLNSGGTLETVHKLLTDSLHLCRTHGTSLLAGQVVFVGRGHMKYRIVMLLLLFCDVAYARPPHPADEPTDRELGGATVPARIRYGRTPHADGWWEDLRLETQRLRYVRTIQRRERRVRLQLRSRFESTRRGNDRRRTLAQSHRWARLIVRLSSAKARLSLLV